MHRLRSPQCGLRWPASTGTENATSDEANKMMSRRELLLRLGLAAGTAYMAPSLVGLDVARASGGGSGGGDWSGSIGSGRGGRGLLSR